jgi:hypothetical protein
MSHSEIVAAICKELHSRYDAIDEQPVMEQSAVVSEIMQRQQAMPDYLRLPVRVLTFCFDMSGIYFGGKRFQKLLPAERDKQFSAWKASRLGLCRNFIRFYESLYLLITLQEAGS